MKLPFVKGSLFADTASMLLAKAMLLFAGLVIGIIIARSLGPSGKGILTIALLVPTYLQWFGSLGITSAHVYFLASNPAKVTSIIGNSLCASLIAAVAGISLFWITFPVTRNSIFSGVEMVFLLLATLIGGIQIIYTYGTAILLGQRRYTALNSVQLLQSGINLGLLTMFLLLFRWGIWGALIATLFSMLLAASFSWKLVLRAQQPIRIDPAFFRAALKYGVATFIGDVILILLFRVDMLLINAWRPSKSEVGFYSIAVTISEIIKNFAEVVHFILFPRISGLDPESGAKLTMTMSRLSLSACMCVQVTVIVLAPSCIQLIFGKAFLPAAIPTKILTTSVASLLVSYNIGAYLAGNGLVWQKVCGSLIALLTMLGLDWLWIRPYGIEGAAWASLIAHSVMAVTFVLIFQKKTAARFRDIFILRRSDLQNLRRLIVRLM